MTGCGPEELDGLIVRLEAVVEGSRELDEAITAVVNPAKAEELRLAGITPSYSRSLDEALELMPDNWSWKLVWEPGRGLYCAVLTDAPRLGVVATTIVCSRPTAPLAVCVVALSARAEKKG